MEKDKNKTSEKPTSSAKVNDKVQKDDNKQEKTKNSKVQLVLLIIIPLLLLIMGGAYYLWTLNSYDPARYAEIMEEGDRAYEELEYSTALDHYIDATEFAPRQYEAYSKIIHILSEKRRFSDAVNIINGVVVHLDPVDYAKLWKDLGDGYVRSKLYLEATDAYEQAYKYDKDPAYVVMIVDVALRAGLIEKASSYIGQIESSSEAVLQVWDNYQKGLGDDIKIFEVVTLAKRYIEDGYSYLASEILLAHIEELENYWEGHYYLGRALYDDGKLDKAVTYFESAVSLGSDHPILYLYLARANNQLAEKNSTYNYYERAISFADETQTPEFINEYVTLLIEDSQKARMEELLARYEDENWAKILMLQLYRSNSEWDEFDVVLEAFSEDEIPSYQQESYNILMAEYNMYFTEDLEEADNYIEKLSSTSMRYLYKGILMVEEGDKEKARINLRRAIDTDLEGAVTELAEKTLSNI